MSHHNPYIAPIATGLVTLSVVFLFAAQQFHSAPGATTSSEPAAQNEDPIAVVKSILVNGTEQLEVPQSEMTVTRVSAAVEAGQAGMLLVAGDEVSTGPNAKATLLFLDAAPEKSNEVLVDSNARIRIGSIFNWFGKVLIRSIGKFDAATEKMKVGATGTEWELVVQADGSNRIRVLEGAVAIQKGSFFPSTTRADVDRVKEPILADGAANMVLSSFEVQARRRARARTLPGAKMEFIAVRGRTTSFEREFVFSNTCSEKHLYEIRAPRNLTWFQLVGADKFDIEGRSSSSISFAIKADAIQVPIGVYEGEIIARCLDCAREPGCQIGGLLLPISVNVIAPPGPPADPGRQVDQAVAQKLQQVVLTADGALVKRNASIEQIDETLNWSNDVIIAGQPSYSAHSIIPRLPSWQERDRQFRTARRGAILNNDPRSYETLGDIYVDWGNGAKAVDALEKVVSLSQTPQRLTSLGEAYRLTGNLPRAQRTLMQTVRTYPEFAPGWNALGNVYKDRAMSAQDKKDYERAKADLQTAKDHYGHARANDVGSITPYSNLGETDLSLGDIAREQGRIGDASRQYKLAEQTFSQAERTSGSYVFATKGLGDVYRGMTKIAMIQRDGDMARAAFARSEQKYTQATGMHRDLAEAYVGLGNLYEDAGRKEEAIRAYWQAIRVRPEAPQAYYHYALAIADRDRRRAAAYAKAYLKLEREVFKQGEKANNARILIGPGPLPTHEPTREPTVTVTVTPTPTPTVTPTPTPSPSPLVRVPNVNGNTLEEALRKLRERGLDGQITEQADCKATGKVLSTSPKRDARVPRGTMVTVFISAAGENAVTVPPLTNRPLSDAQQELRSLGLVASVRRRQETNSVRENTVLEQNPEANRKLKPGCPVELTISIRVQMVEVPNYIGLTREEALRRLPRFFGTLNRGRIVEVDSNQFPGTVIDQSPRPGEMVRPGTTVDLVVSKSQRIDRPPPPDEVYVPDLRGMTEQQAESALLKNGLRKGNVTYREGGKLDTVTDQDPKPHLRVPRGKAVNIVIANIG